MKLMRIPLLGLLGLLPLLSQDVLAASAAVLDGIVVQVEEDLVLQSELNRRINSVRRQIEGRGGRLPPSDVLRKQVLERLVSESIQLQMAKRGGARVGDEQLNAAIEDMARGNRLSLEQFRSALATEGVSYAVFREDIRNEMLVSQMRQRVVGRRIFVSEQEIQNMLSQMEQQGAEAPQELRLGHIMLTVAENASSADLQKAQGRADELLAKLQGGADFAELAVANSASQEALEGGDLGWRNLNQLPGLFADAVRKLKKGELAPVLRSPNGFHILKVMDQRGGELGTTMVNQTQARHILIKTSAVMDDVQAREKLIALRDQILGGADFATLAKTESADTGSASQGGDLGWANPGQFVPEFEQTMAETGINAISAPFRSPFGWHILQVTGRRTQDQTEELKKNRAAQLLQQRKFGEEQEEWLREIRTEAFVKYLQDEDKDKNKSGS
ncbi:MAG: peptidylprolyl isomerase SurA [Gammaproteobacteria bacterium]|nr:peptidylprolyl isomerase SurA [Gammaproteobacteria bacterium]